jgi:uncharacterized protein YgbK (DUF1537 family)
MTAEMPIVLALADDLTGALEAGAKFAGRGVRSAVTTRVGVGGNYPVLSVDTESRHLRPEEAAATVRAAVLAGVRILYKKTDSTLRGNIAAELGALAEVHPGSRIAYVPAYPAMGRTVRNGRLLVHGVPVHQTSFAADSLNPVPDNSIARLLGDDLPCDIHDGETDADVAQAVASALADPRCRVIAGPASVAEALAAQLDLPRRPVEAWPRVERCLIVSGSQHEISVRQIEWATEHGCASPEPAAEWRILPGGTGRVVRDLLAASVVDGLMVFGGDTAFGILEALGRPLLEPIGEVVAGVPVSHVAGRKLVLISKAGGFGDEGVVGQVKDTLNGNRR